MGRDARSIREAAKLLRMPVDELALRLSNSTRPSPSNSSNCDETLTPGPDVVHPDIFNQEPYYDAVDEEFLAPDEPTVLLKVNDQTIPADNNNLSQVFGNLESAFNDLYSDNSYVSREGSSRSSLYQHEINDNPNFDEYFQQPQTNEVAIDQVLVSPVQTDIHQPLNQVSYHAQYGVQPSDAFNPYETRTGPPSAEPWNTLAHTVTQDNYLSSSKVGEWEQVYDKTPKVVESISTSALSQKSDPSWINVTPPAATDPVTAAVSSSPVTGVHDISRPDTVLPRYGPTPMVSPPRPEHLSMDWTEAAQLHPCSNVWQHYSPEYAPSQSNRSPPRKRSCNEMEGDERFHRSRFENEQDRENAKLTRRANACIRCRYQKITCRPDPYDLHGPCLTCKQAKRPTAANLPCMRYKVTESSVYRYQDKPFQLFTTRWPSMDLVDITEWASTEIVTVNFTQVFLNVPIRLEVRKFVPKPGDMLHKQWQVGNVTHKHEVPHYAIANLDNMKEVYQRFIEEHIGVYLSGMIEYRSLDRLFITTYEESMRHRLNAKTKIEFDLIYNTQKLWVACRMTSHPHHLVGPENLGGQPVRDATSPWHDKIPMPPVMVAQSELIIYSQFLQPLSRDVLHNLQKLIYDNKRVHWYTIYLVLFMLLHSCSMITRRDEEYARQINAKNSRYANPDAIDGHHSGAQTMLAHFHYINKGDKPFAEILNPLKHRFFVEEVGLTKHQTDFVRMTAMHVQRLDPIFKELKTTRDYGNDLYWVAQLYDTDWRPHIFVD